MEMYEAFGTAVFIVCIVFLVLVSLWLLLRVMSAIVRKLESLFSKGGSNTPSNPQ